MERIPRTAAAAIAVAIAIGLGSAGPDTRATVTPAAPAASVDATTGQGSVLRALGPSHALRSGRVRLSITVPQARPGGRVRVVVASPRLSGVSRLDLRVDGVRAAAFSPAHGRFSGAAGWIDRSRFAAGRHQVTLTISRRRRTTLRAARTVIVPAALRRAQIIGPAPYPRAPLAPRLTGSCGAHTSTGTPTDPVAATRRGT